MTDCKTDMSVSHFGEEEPKQNIIQPHKKKKKQTETINIGQQPD